MRRTRFKRSKVSKITELTEHQIQSQCFAWVDAMIPTDKRFEAIFAIPNGGKRHIGQAVKLKKEGVRAGVWDIAVLVPSEKFNAHGLMVEMKRPKGTLSPEQKQWRAIYSRYRYANQVAKSLEEFKLIIETYFEL